MIGLEPPSESIMDAAVMFFAAPISSTVSIISLHRKEGGGQAWHVCDGELCCVCFCCFCCDLDILGCCCMCRPEMWPLGLLPPSFCASLTFLFFKFPENSATPKPLYFVLATHKRYRRNVCGINRIIAPCNAHTRLISFTCVWFPLNVHEPIRLALDE